MGVYSYPRTPVRPRERLITLFRSPQNIKYLRGLFTETIPPGPLRKFALDTLEDSVHNYERIEDFIYSDPIAHRGDARPAADLWAELRRLNRTFYEYRKRFLRDKAALLSGHSGGDGLWDDDEPYHYRMFTADSLRPPGHESLNGAGPLYEILEDQVVASRARQQPLDPGVASDDWNWDGGNPHRTPEQALAEYWGEGRVESTALGSHTGGASNLDHYGQGPLWRETGGTRFMRYPTIPIWQNLSRAREYDHEIEETLGAGGRECDNHVRRWALDRVRKPRGEEYRRYGPRSGSTV